MRLICLSRAQHLSVRQMQSVPHACPKRIVDRCRDQLVAYKSNAFVVSPPIKSFEDELHPLSSRFLLSNALYPLDGNDQLLLSS